MSLRAAARHGLRRAWVTAVTLAALAVTLVALAVTLVALAVTLVALAVTLVAVAVTLVAVAVTLVAVAVTLAALEAVPSTPAVVALSHPRRCYGIPMLRLACRRIRYVVAPTRLVKYLPLCG